MLVVDLGKWMNKTLINWGIDPAVADRFDGFTDDSGCYRFELSLPGNSYWRYETVYET